MDEQTKALIEALLGGKCPKCRGWGEVAYFGELVQCGCFGKYEAPISMEKRREAADALQAQAERVKALEAFVRNAERCASHGLMGDWSIALHDIKREARSLMENRNR